MLTTGSALALFSMLAISSISLFLAQRARIPHTVFLVAIGIIIAVLAKFPLLSFFNEFTLTPELLFFLFLPTLLFESAYNINMKHLTKDAVIISILSIISLVVSAFAIALGLDMVFSWLDLTIPFILLLVFGAIISATDPVAVLALFKEYGAPKRLSLIFEGESIFNDGTAVALFLVILTIAESGIVSTGEVAHGILSFIIMVIGGALFGLLFGGIFAKIIGWCRSNEFAAITLTMVLAHTTFICAELFSHNVTIGGTHVYLSSIIATAVASLLMGNYGRLKMPAHASEFVEKYWSQFAFMANSLVFIMIGMLVIKLPESTPGLLIPILATIIIVATARALSIYPIVYAFNAFTKKDRRVPKSWQHVLAWGSLRGALAVTMVLMIPDDLTFASWSLPYSPKEFVLAITVGCVFATLFIKATTIGALMGKLKLNTFTQMEEVNFREMLLYIHRTSLTRLAEAYEKSHISGDTYTVIKKEQEARIEATQRELATFTDTNTLKKVMHLYAMGIERKHVRSLYEFGEIPESVTRKIINKLEYQQHAIEHDTFDSVAYEHGQERDIFEIIANALHRYTTRTQKDETTIVHTYLYYRALAIISRKVIKELEQFSKSFDTSCVAIQTTLTEIIEIYASYREGSTRKLQEIRVSHAHILSPIDMSLARKSLQKREMDALEKLKEREMVTPKVAIEIHERIARESAI
ncbi:MAG TPA: sodium:proton antiporter [Candidatus Paceibacterota bacterium]|nr:sodium:proton antiporter [Candidatus Paceibacterota bacterium]